LGNRLSRIYTRTGDDGTTGLGNGARVRKDDARVEAYGTVDELNSVLGTVVPLDVPPDIAALIASLQQKLFDLGGELCIPDRVVIEPDDVSRLEQELDRLNASLPPLKEFVLPGGNAAAAACHLARAVCRRAERRVISMSETAAVNTHSIRYLNRMSDLLFVVARTLNMRSGHNEVLWTGGNRTAGNQPPDADD
jgi:cob(I)alamin adenosyltransferase